MQGLSLQTFLYLYKRMPSCLCLQTHGHLVGWISVQVLVCIHMHLWKLLCLCVGAQSRVCMWTDTREICQVRLEQKSWKTFLAILCRLFKTTWRNILSCGSIRQMLPKSFYSERRRDCGFTSSIMMQKCMRLWEYKCVSNCFIPDEEKSKKIKGKAKNMESKREGEIR